jgi:hypothetical protein
MSGAHHYQCQSCEEEHRVKDYESSCTSICIDCGAIFCHCFGAGVEGHCCEESRAFRKNTPPRLKRFKPPLSELTIRKDKNNQPIHLMYVNEEVEKHSDDGDSKKVAREIKDVKSLKKETNLLDDEVKKINSFPAAAPTKELPRSFSWIEEAEKSEDGDVEDQYLPKSSSSNLQDVEEGNEQENEDQSIVSKSKKSFSKRLCLACEDGDMMLARIMTHQSKPQPYRPDEGSEEEKRGKNRIKAHKKQRYWIEIIDCRSYECNSCLLSRSYSKTKILNVWR